MSRLAKLHKIEFANEFLFFRVALMLGNAVSWSYYMILLLRESNNDISTVFLNSGVQHAGLALGFLVASAFLNKLGYLKVFRISFFFQFIILIVTLLTLPRILEVHLILALFRGVFRGMFWSASNTYQLREIHGTPRSKLFSTLTGLSYIIEVILPITIGGLIVNYGYELVFVVGAAVFLVAAVYPWKYNKKPRDPFKLSKIKQFSLRPGFKRWFALSLFDEIFGNQRALALMVLPFLFIGDEFGVGALGSLLGFVSGLVVFIHRSDSIKKKLKFGYFGSVIIDIANVGLALVWNLPALIIRGIAAKIGFALYTPPRNDLFYRNRELLMGDFSHQGAVEMELLAEIIRFAARMLNLGIIHPPCSLLWK